MTLLPLANPLTSISLLLALGRGYTHEERNRQVDRGAIYVAAILLVCFYAGHAIMTGFGISIPRVAPDDNGVEARKPNVENVVFVLSARTVSAPPCATISVNPFVFS